MWQLNWLETLPWSSWQWRTLALKSLYKWSCYGLLLFVWSYSSDDFLRSFAILCLPSWTKGSCPGFRNSIDKICWIGLCSTLEAPVFHQICHYITIPSCRPHQGSLLHLLRLGLGLCIGLPSNLPTTNFVATKQPQVSELNHKKSQKKACAMILHDSCCGFWCLEH